MALCDVDDRRAAQTFNALRQCAEVQRLPPDAGQGSQEHRRRDRRHSGPHARHRGHVVHGARQARLRAKAAGAHGLGSAAIAGSGRPSTTSPPRWATRATRNEGTRQAAEIIWNGDIGGVTEVHAWSDRPMWPQGLTEIPKEDPVPSTLDWDLWLGVAEKRPFTADGKTDPDRNGGFFYQPFNWRGFYDFGCGALGDMACHILGAPNMALHLSQPRSDQRGVHQEGRREPLHVPQGQRDPVRLRRLRRHAGAEGVLVRRAEGDSEDRRRARRRMAGRSAELRGARRQGGGRGRGAAGAAALRVRCSGGRRGRRAAVRWARRVGGGTRPATSSIRRAAFSTRRTSMR